MIVQSLDSRPKNRDQFGRTKEQTNNWMNVPGRSGLFTVMLVYSILKLVTIIGYWWHNFDVGDIFRMLVPGTKVTKSYHQKISSPSFVTIIRHHHSSPSSSPSSSMLHRCNQNSVYTQFSRIIDVTLKENIFEEKWADAWLSINIVNVLQ